jgi:hypothetical protein
MKKFVLCFAYIFITLYAFGVSKTPRFTTIDWGTANDWSPSGVPANGDEVTIPSGYTVYLKKSVYKSSTPDLHITIAGTLAFEPSGQLELGIGATIKLESSASMIQSSGTGSELIKIGTEIKFTGKMIPSTVTGPAFASIETGEVPSGFTPTPLPIKLTHFSARTRSETVVLTWHSSLEEGADHFQVERSTNAFQWYPLATVATRGSNSSYTYTDAAPLSTASMYRLKLVDADGTYSYSPIVRVAASGPSIGLQLGPNPATNYLQVTLAQPGSQLLQLQVLTASGLEVKQVTVASTGFIRLNLEGLARGQYYLVVKDKQQVLEQKAFVVK